MTRLTLPMRSLVLTAVVIGVATLGLAPMLASAAAPPAKKSLPIATIALTSKGIVATPKSLKGGQQYQLTIKNNLSEPRGVELIGIDKAKSPYVRYTKILDPGKSETFKWYFAKGKTVYVRELVSCTHDQRSCVVATFGRMRLAIDVD